MAHPSSPEYFCGAIRDVMQAISEKCQVLGDILATSQSKFHVIERDVHKKVFNQTPLVEEMDRVFQQLRGSSVATSETYDPSSPTSAGKTLFDYVDAETVQSLQQDAMEQTREIEEMLAMHRDALDRVVVMFEYFSSFQKQFGAQINHVTQTHPTHQDVKSLESLYDAAVRFFVDMEQCDRFLLRYFSTINDVYPHYESAIVEAETLFDELRNLEQFYRQFHSSCQQLGREFDRRRAYENKVHKLLQDTMTKLQIYEQEEHQARAAFVQQHARFLPASLCPDLKNLPDQYEIVRLEHDEPSSIPH